MSGKLSEPFETLAAVTAVVTLPVGILAAIFLGGTEAAVVFVVGWLLLVPLFGVLSGADVGTTPEEVERWMDVAERAEEMDGDGESEDENPLELLRDRYARGEIDEAEFERRVERLVATEEIPPGAISDSSTTDEAGPEVDRELERDAEADREQ